MCRYLYRVDGFFILTIRLGAASVLALPGLLGPQVAPAQAFPLDEAVESSFEDSIGPEGIDALALQKAPYRLSGRKIAIGQVEPGRPALFGFDKKVAPGELGLPLAGLFYQNKAALENNNVDVHAHNVASLMVGNAKARLGIAPEARLYSAALGSRRTGSGQPEQCLTLNHVALQNGTDVRAINLSFGESLRQDGRLNPLLDGNALLTQCVDWSARVHDTLYTVAGNQGDGGIPIPTDQYNGLTVAYTRKSKGIFSKVDFANLGDELVGVAYRFAGRERNVGDRNSVSLVAPGNKVQVLNPDGKLSTMSGTSFAAPHVTATVALLQEYGDSAKFGPAGRRHEVMKAVLLNAADKLQDGGNGRLLGMAKTIQAQDNHDWSRSPAFRSQTLPLDPLMGAGQLNALRAYQQFSAGRFTPQTTVAVRGWDYGQVGIASQDPTLGRQPPVTYADYVLEKPLRAGDYMAATLVWDRRVELIDENSNDAYDLGEKFRDRGLNNLDLYLMRAEDTDSSRSIWSSRSSVDSVEHIFHPIPVTGRYKLRVQYQQQRHQPTQSYGLAWWAPPRQSPQP